MMVVYMKNERIERMDTSAIPAVLKKMIFGAIVVGLQHPHLGKLSRGGRRQRYIHHVYSRRPFP
jgi:hypothetical protein